MVAFLSFIILGMLFWWAFAYTKNVESRLIAVANVLDEQVSRIDSRINELKIEIDHAELMANNAHIRLSRMQNKKY